MNDQSKAVAFMVTATTFIAATTLLAKALGTDTLGPALHPVQVTLMRFLFAFILIASTVAALRPNLVRPDLTLHVKRTTCGFLGVTLMFAAAASIPLSDATAISFLNPVIGMLLAIPLLGERIGKWRWIAVAFSLTGALILIRPGGDGIATGALFALGAAMALGFELIFIKRLSGKESPLQVLLMNNLLGLAVASLCAIFFWQPVAPLQWMAGAALGGLMACAQFCFVNAMSRSDASFVTPFSYLTLVFATLYDLIIFGTTPDHISLVGAAIIIAGAALLAWRERANASRIS